MTSFAIRRPRIPTAAPDLPLQAAAGLGVAALTVALTWYFDGHGLVVGAGAAALVGVLAWLATTSRTQLALALFMVYIGVLDGYLKLATGVAAVSLVRDVLLFAIVAGVLMRAQVRGTRMTAPPLTAWVAGFTVLVLVQLFNPQGGTLAHSLGGLRQHLEFVPLFFLTFAFVRTTRSLRVFVILLLLIATANGIANVVQFNLTPEQLASWGPGYAERVLATGRFSYSGRTYAEAGADSYRTRPFGLGSEAGSGGVVGALALGGIVAIASLSGRRRYLLFAVAMAIGAVAAIVTSQGRGAVVCAMVVALAYGLLTATSRARIRGLLVLAVACILVMFSLQAVVGSLGSSAFRYEGLGAADIVKTAADARPGSATAVVTAITTYPLGAGLATAGPASGSPGGTDISYEVNAESQFAFSTLETGVAGMVLLVAFTIMLLALALRRLRHEPDREARALLAALFAPIAGMLALYYPGPVTPTTPIGPYLWAIAGIAAYWLIARPEDLHRECPRQGRSAVAANP